MRNKKIIPTPTFEDNIDWSILRYTVSVLLVISLIFYTFKVNPSGLLNVFVFVVLIVIAVFATIGTLIALFDGNRVKDELRKNAQKFWQEEMSNIVKKFVDEVKISRQISEMGLAAFFYKNYSNKSITFEKFSAPVLCKMFKGTNRRIAQEIAQELVKQKIDPKEFMIANRKILFYKKKKARSQSSSLNSIVMASAMTTMNSK